MYKNTVQYYWCMKIVLPCQQQCICHYSRNNRTKTPTNNNGSEKKYMYANICKQNKHSRTHISYSDGVHALRYLFLVQMNCCQVI